MSGNRFLWLILNVVLACGGSGPQQSPAAESGALPPSAAMVMAATDVASREPAQSQMAASDGRSSPSVPVVAMQPMTKSMGAGAPPPAAAAGTSSAAPVAGVASVEAPDAGTPHDGGKMGESKPTVACPAMSIEPGDSTGSIETDGARRSYVLHVPPKYKGDTAVPLLIDMHGLFGTGQGQRSGSGTAAVADREGFIVAYPDGIDNAWNVGPCCTYDRNVDDVKFMLALVDKIKTQACIDASRVYAMGVSMGGGMSHYLACEAADTFAAVAPAAFDLLEENTCKPSRPIAVLSSRGTADNIVPYAGGASTPPNGVQTTIHFRGAKGTFEEWARINGCTDKPSASYDECQSYTACNAGVEVTLCTKQGGGHTYGDPERAWKMLSKYGLP